jgi:hypothetical protein
MTELKKCTKEQKMKDINDFVWSLNTKKPFGSCAKCQQSIWKLRAKKDYKEKRKQYNDNHLSRLSTEEKELRAKKQNERQKEKYKKNSKELNKKQYEKRKQNPEILEKYKQSTRDHYQKNKDYYFAKKQVREERVKEATPSWVSVSDIQKIKEQCKKDQHIDHIIPINAPIVSIDLKKGEIYKGRLVCGLNVPANLQILSSKENLSKSNKFDGTLENKSWRKDL